MRGVLRAALKRSGPLSYPINSMIARGIKIAQSSNDITIPAYRNGRDRTLSKSLRSKSNLTKILSMAFIIAVSLFPLSRFTGAFVIRLSRLLRPPLTNICGNEYG